MTAVTIVPHQEARFETRQIHDMSTAEVRQMLSEVVMNKDSPSKTALGSFSAIEFALFIGEGNQYLFQMFAKELQTHFKVQRIGWHNMLHDPHFLASIGATRHHKVLQLRLQGRWNEYDHDEL